jgi:hypothetical protein
VNYNRKKKFILLLTIWGNYLIESKVAKVWVFFDENKTVDVN